MRHNPIEPLNREWDKKAKAASSLPDNNQTRIETSGLPCLPETLTRLLDACNRADGDFAPAAAVAALDPGLAAQLLDAACACPDFKPQRFVSLVELLARLGQGAIRTIAVHAAVGHLFPADVQATAFDFHQFWRKAVRGAYLGQLLASKTGYGNPQEAYLAGLLRDLGQLALLTAHRHEYGQILKEVRAVSELMLAEKNRFGVSHLEVAEQVVRRWRLNSFLADAIYYQHHSLESVQGAHPLVKIINLAAHLANRAGKLSDPQFDHGRSLFGLTPDDLIDLVRNADDAVTQAAEELDLSPPSEGQAAGSESRFGDLARQVRTFALLAAANKITSQASVQDAAMAVLAEQLRVAFGFRAPLAFLLDDARNCLVGHVLPGQSELVGQLEIPLQQGHSLAADSLRARDSLHSFEPSQHGRRSVIDEQIARLAGARGVLCVPLIHRGVVLGVAVIGIEEADLAKIDAERETLRAFAAHAAQSIAAAPAAYPGGEVQALDVIPMSRARLSKVIHEVNNPLGIMKNYIKILRLKMSREDPAQFGLGVIDEEIDRVARIVGELTDAAEPPAAAEEPVNINLLVFDLVRITNEPLLIRDNIRLKTELDHAVKPLRCDKGKLKQVLVNLVKNAAEAMPHGGEIIVSTRDEVRLDGANFVEIAVADSGPGIPAEVLDHLFEPGQSSKGGGHLGLGLSIVNGLVRELGGVIRCKSNNKNGTRFQVLLPGVLSVA